jgi:hypothetical protein
LKFQKHKFLLENPSSTNCVPSTITVPSSSPDPVVLLGNKQKITAKVKEDLPVVNPDWIPPFELTNFKLKILKETSGKLHRKEINK